jgi:ribonuclease P protein component
VLPAPHRLTHGGDIRRVVRTGRRSGGDLLVASVLRHDGGDPVRVGFVVGRMVGNAVVRHRVQRRLRHLCRERLPALPVGGEVVVRALPPAACASYVELGVELDRCLERSLALPQGTGKGR